MQISQTTLSHKKINTYQQYVDDLPLCSPCSEACKQDSIHLLKLLANKNHKVSEKNFNSSRLKLDIWDI